jgi:hypothetical protein
VICKLKNGNSQTFQVNISKGHPGNPIGWDDMKTKFSTIIKDEILWNKVREFGGTKKATILKSFT